MGMGMRKRAWRVRCIKGSNLGCMNNLAGYARESMKGWVHEKLGRVWGSPWQTGYEYIRLSLGQPGTCDHHHSIYDWYLLWDFRKDLYFHFLHFPGICSCLLHFILYIFLDFRLLFVFLSSFCNCIVLVIVRWPPPETIFFVKVEISGSDRFWPTGAVNGFDHIIP